MKILLTGGAGFIGSHIADYLINSGHEVWIVDNLLSGKKENLNPDARFIKMDISDPHLLKIMKNQKFDFVIHHAAHIDVRLSVNNPVGDARTNIIGTLNLLEGCRRGGVKGIVFASSGGAIYGQPDRLPAGENCEKRPLSPYGVSKISAEYYLFCFTQLWGIPYVSLRYGNVYGPRQNTDGESGVVAIFAGKLLRGETPIIFGDGEQTRDYVYVNDVVKANILALHFMEDWHSQVQKSKFPIDINSMAFNISSGKTTSVNELFNLLNSIIACQGRVQYDSPRRGELESICLDTSKAKEILGWDAQIDIVEGLNKTMNYLGKGLNNS